MDKHKHRPLLCPRHQPHHRGPPQDLISPQYLPQAPPPETFPLGVMHFGDRHSAPNRGVPMSPLSLAASWPFPLLVWCVYGSNIAGFQIAFPL